jgi:P27 family predicted phage terminase small subunit
MAVNKRGPRPKPTALKLLHGDRPDRINLQEPVAETGMPECPDSANDEVRAIWDYTVTRLHAMGCAALPDRDMLYAYCEAVALHRVVSRAISDTIELLSSPTSRVVNPATPTMKELVRMQKIATDTMRMMGANFGLSPASRAGIKVGDKPGDADAAERFLTA